MKKSFLLCMLLVTFFAVKSQDLLNLKPTGYVNDYENIFTSEQKADLEKICSEYEKKTSIEICLATSADFNLDQDVELANKWGVGKDGLDNGLMIILSKSQRDCSIKTGYGLEPFLPDGKLKEFTNDIYPRTLSQDMFYEGMKELILTCQKQMGDEGFAFMTRYKQIQDEYNAGMTKIYWFRILQIALFLIFLGGITFLIYRKIKKDRDFKALKNEILSILKEIENLKNKINLTTPLPNDLQILYDNRIQDLSDKLTTIETKLQTQYIYNQLLNYNQIINTTQSNIELILGGKKDIERYLQDKYPYCEKYLKNELNSIIPDVQQDVFTSKEYTRERMNTLVGIQSILDNKVKNFLNKTQKIDGILNDNKFISKKIEDLNKSYIEYVEKKTILSGSKIGKRYSSLVNLEFDKYIPKLQSDINGSLKSLENGDYDSAVTSYGSFIAILAVVTGAFVSVTSLLTQYNKSDNFVNTNQSKIDDLISDIENKINKSGVSYTRKSTLEEVKKEISKYKVLISTDIIGASVLLDSIIKGLDELLHDIKSDISSHEDEQRRKAAAVAAAALATRSSYSSTRSSSGFGGFGGGGFGGGGSRSGF